jgi:hypothetical protein
MREGIGFSECCLLRPYSPNAFGNNYGVQSRALVFANGTTPELLPGEVEPGMGQFPVIIEKPTETFDSTLRLDFSEVYKIEHNVKVRNVGRIDRKHLKLLNSAFLEATEASQPEIDSQWAGFGNNNDWLYKARRSQGYSYDSPMNDRMAAPAVGPFARPGFPDDGARGFNYNTQKVDNVARGNFNTQTLNNMAMPTAGPFARSGSPNNDARSLATSTALSPDYDDPYVSGSQTGLLHRGMD